jgi:hypothetical protein
MVEWWNIGMVGFGLQLGEKNRVMVRFETQFGKEFKNGKHPLKIIFQRSIIPSTNYAGCCYRNIIFTMSCRVSETL